MKIIDPSRKYIDYFQSNACARRRGLINRYGIRVWENLVLSLVKFGDGQPTIVSKEFQIPVQFEHLPSYVRMVLDDHLLHNPSSDLIELLIGKKSFLEALGSPHKIDVETAANVPNRLANAS